MLRLFDVLIFCSLHRAVVVNVYLATFEMMDAMTQFLEKAYFVNFAAVGIIF